MNEWLVALSSALWFGILTSISPCPLATNIAAVSFLGRRVDSAKGSLLVGLAYCSGRMASYIGLAAVLVSSVMAAPALSQFLQANMNQYLGPVLLLIGVALLGLIPLPSSNFGLSNAMQQRLASKGMIGAFGLGAIFALSFCPTSAALFFASLLPLISMHDSVLWLPAAYGVGTAAPVIAIALVVALGGLQLGKLYQGLEKVEHYARILSGIIFVGAGGYYCWSYLMPQII